MMVNVDKSLSFCCSNILIFKLLFLSCLLYNSGLLTQLFIYQRLLRDLILQNYDETNCNDDRYNYAYQNDWNKSTGDI